MDHAAGVHALTDNVLASHYDSGSIARGRMYAAERRVTILDTHTGAVRALVVGGARQPYRTEVEWYASPRRGVIHDSCSCPLGGSCKHAVAVILTLRGARPIAADWRRALVGLRPDHEERLAVPMAIEFVVATARPTKYVPNPSTHVTLRPLRMGAKGKWVRTGASWRDVASPYGYRSSDLDADHLAVVRALLSARTRDRYDIPTRLSSMGAVLGSGRSCARRRSWGSRWSPNGRRRMGLSSPPKRRAPTSTSPRHRAGTYESRLVYAPATEHTS